MTLLRRALALPEGQVSETILLRSALGALLGSDDGAQLVREAQRQLSERGVADPVQYARGDCRGCSGAGGLGDAARTAELALAHA